ncbi:MAG TPA: hypothetical protein VE981_04400 [Planctomycetota bacterium]|nr:hypothetical protein [Planctomycetota bacterium]
MKRLAPALLLAALAACGSPPSTPSKGQPQDQDVPDVTMGMFNPGGNHVTYDASNGNKLTLVFGTPEQGGFLEEVHLSQGLLRQGYHFVRLPKGGQYKFEVTEMTEAQTLLRHTMESTGETGCTLKLDGTNTAVQLSVIPGPDSVRKTLFIAEVGGNRIMELGIGIPITKIDPYFLSVFFLMGQWARQNLAVGSLVMNWLANRGLSRMSLADDQGQIDLSPMVRKVKDENGDERYDFFGVKRVRAGAAEQTATFWRRDDGQIEKIEVSAAGTPDKVTWTRNATAPWSVEEGRLVLRRLDIVLGFDPDDAERARLKALGESFSRAIYEAFDGQASLKELRFYSKKAGRNPTQPGVIWIGRSLADVKSVDPYANYCFDDDPKKWSGVLAFTYASNPLHGNAMYSAMDRLDIARRQSAGSEGIVLLHEFMHSYWNLDEEYANAKGEVNKGSCPLSTVDRGLYKACVMDNKMQPELCRAKFHSSDTRQQVVRKCDCATHVAKMASKYLKFDLVFKDVPSLGDAKNAPPTKILFN